MPSKQIILTLPEKIFNKLKKEKQDYGYLSVQEIILEVLRKEFFKNKSEKETRGRPEKFDVVKFVTSKKPMFK